MSTISDFNRIEDCNKTPAECVDAYVEAKLNEDDQKTLEVLTSWGNSAIDLSPIVNVAETLTTLYLSPTNDPNCLVYEPERGDNICIHGDDLSRIISMKYLKDVDQTIRPSDGDIYMYDGTKNLFVPYDLKTVIYNINVAIQNIQATLANHETRLQTIEEKLTPPSDAPSGVKVVFGNINTYSDPNAVINSSGTATTLDKTHGLYTHTLNTSAYGDELFG